MTEFKTGDKVEVSESSVSNGLIEGQTFTVATTERDLVYVYGRSDGFFSYRFRLVTKTPADYWAEGYAARDAEVRTPNPYKEIEHYAGE